MWVLVAKQPLFETSKKAEKKYQVCAFNRVESVGKPSFSADKASPFPSPQGEMGPPFLTSSSLQNIAKGYSHQSNSHLSFCVTLRALFFFFSFFFVVCVSYVHVYVCRHMEVRGGHQMASRHSWPYFLRQNLSLKMMSSLAGQGVHRLHLPLHSPNVGVQTLLAFP